MGLISKLEDKLSGNKSHTEEERLREQQTGTGSSGITGGTHSLVGDNNSSRTHGSSGLTGSHTGVGNTSHNTSGLTGQGSHLAGAGVGSHDGSGGLMGSTHGSGLTGGSHTGTGIGGSSQHSGAGVGGNTHGSGIMGGTPLDGSHSGPGSTGNTHGSALTGGSHGSGLTGSSHAGTGIGGSSQHSGPGVGGNTHGSGIMGGTPLNGSHSGPGLTGNTHGSGLTGGSHTGTGIGGNTHGSGITGGTAVGSGIIGSSNRHEAGDTGSRSHVPGTHSTGSHNTQHGSLGTQHGDFVPGSHPAASNPEAIPTAGGHKVGGVGEGAEYRDRNLHTGAHETTGDKIKNVVPGQHNAHDAYGNPINTHSTTSSHTTSSGITGGSHSGVGSTHGSSGLTGNHAHNTQPGSGFSSAAQPLGHDSSFHDRHSGPGVGTGLAAGAVGGAGLAGAGHQDEYARGQQAAYQQHGNGSNLTGSHSSGLAGSHNTTTTTTGYAGEDNRGFMDKAKDKLSKQRSDGPDDPITGTNYDQKNRDQYTSGPAHGGSLTGTHTTGSGLTSGTHTYGSGTHQQQQQPGVGGITRGVDNTHIGSGSHSGAGAHAGSGLTGSSHGHVEGRGAAYEAGFKDAVAALAREQQQGRQ